MAEVKTAHPYIVTDKRVLGGKPIIKGTRIPVWIVIGWNKRGYSPEIIQKDIYPHLSLSQIHDALSYYYENKSEVDNEIDENNLSSEELMRRAGEWSKPKF